ncbi:hypothetical protein GBAR_LOCUS24757 [Geodia barretti]|uniref:Uncharacterized protein n=1 Tax=Geodia barretti TaxID=519541 RepID=A0AA35TBA6_GEOBA|nr:hypothetical protein GBAR_LOCUS24757 [Geodia barretti]
MGETPPSPTTSSPNDGQPIEVIIGGAVVGANIIILLLSLSLAVAVCCICCRNKGKDNRESEPNDLSWPSRQSSLAVPYTVSSMTPTGRSGIFDYDIDTKTSTTFEPGNISRTPSVPLVTMTDIHRHSTHSSRSGSFSSIDPNELTYANMNDNNDNKV